MGAYEEPIRNFCFKWSIVGQYLVVSFDAFQQHSYQLTSFLVC